MTSSTERTEIEIAATKPPLEDFKTEMNNSLQDARDFYSRNAIAFDTRFALWENQSADGRKHSTNGFTAFPWENSSDTRIRTVDMIVNEQKALLTTSLERMTMQVTGTKSQTMDWSQRMASLLRWYLLGPMADEVDQETELLADWMLTFGSAILAVDWCEERSWETMEIKRMDLLDHAKQQFGPVGMEKMLELIQDPLQEPLWAQFMKQVSPWITDAVALRIVRDLRKLGYASYERPYLQSSKPSVCALQTFYDVFFPAGTGRLQQARWIARRELLTETELRHRVENEAYGWDKKFVDKVIDECRGKTWNMGPQVLEMRARARDMNLGSWFGRQQEQTRDLYEVWHFHYRASNKRGLPAIYKTVMHPEIADQWAKHEVLGYRHGEYPFIEFVRERTSRNILVSRGIPEVSDTAQSEIKVQRDSRVDRSSVTTLPPLKKKIGATGEIQFGPGAELPMKKMDDLEVMNMGAPDGTSIEVEHAVRRDLNEYHGRRAEGVPPQLCDLHDQALVGRWLKRWRVAGVQMLKLAQQYTPEFTLARVAGLVPRPFEITREAIAGNFDLILEFDARFAQQDFLFGFMERMEKYVLPADTGAVVNRDLLIQWVMRSINPTLADTVVRDPQQAEQSEIMDELNNIVMMVGGVEPPMKTKGQNFQKRLEILNAQLGINPFYQTLSQARPDFMQMVQRRVEFLTQQVTQIKNRQIGMLGTQPSATNQMIEGGGMQQQG